MAITADQISINPSLTKALGAIGTSQQGAISDAYAKKKGQFMSDARPSAFGPGSYGASRFSAGENLSQGNLQSGMEQVLGNASYGDWKSNRDFNQNMDLARLSGELAQPSTLEQVLSGLGGGAQTGGQFMGLYNSLKKQPSGTSYTPTSSPNYGYYNSGGSGLNLTGY